MSTYVVLGTSPSVDATVAVGPFRSADRASDAWQELTALGFVAETVVLQSVAEVSASPGWDES